MSNQNNTTNLNIYSILLAGGIGTRLWPISRKLLPKQLAYLTGSESLIQSTVRRLHPILDEDKVRIICGLEYYYEIKRHLEDIGIPADNKIITEPCGRNTAPAILLASLKILKTEEDAILIILPADHVISDVSAFQKKVKTSIKLAEMGHIVTFGIKPNYPETGYGYIEGAESIDKDSFAIKRFVEKPDRKTAEQYINAGNFFWNSGMFAFKTSVILEEYRIFQPNLLQKMQEMIANSDTVSLDSYQQLPDISLDYAIMENTKRGVVLPSDFGWNDIGSWKSLYDFSSKDVNNNVIEGDVITRETKNSFIKGHGRLIVANGLDNTVVVETPDAVFVSDLSKSQDVKSIVKELENLGRKEYQAHTTVFRPWGYYTNLEEKENTKIKRIVVYPGSKLSLQMHYHRNEHWIVVQGEAKIINGEQTLFLKENETTYIPKTTRHRLENVGETMLHIIEVQMGTYLEEDDIVRFDDDFGRIDKKDIL